MNDYELKKAIQDSIQRFNSQNLSHNAFELFKILGYDTSRQNPLVPKTYQEFKRNFIRKESSFHEDKAFTDEWIWVDFLFQLTQEELSNQSSFFNTHQVNDQIIESYLFFAIELKNQDYSRTKLAQITREINKVFSIPSLILFKHGNTLTLSVINRRLHKRDRQKDVLEKVTLIKDISVSKPHRAHIEILYDLSLSELVRVHRVTNFVELHHAWQKTLDSKELNKRFYKELSEWYFWATQKVTFPGLYHTTKNPTQEALKEQNSKNLIRLLTRLLFVWFVKEKGLIPEELFDEKFLKDELLNHFDPNNPDVENPDTKGSRYYRAVLQNLFFATLNKPVEKREFRKDGQHMNIHNLMRYKRYFKNPDLFIDLVEKKVPFMNGGLFECLDKPDPEKKGPQGGDVIIYEDGFSDRPDNRLCVPDDLFFTPETHADLSRELGDKRKKDVKTCGLLNILKKYKFTVAENTPIEEDIALDPELLGRVFENLLASYNPETKTTARKQTGSFYTPREIVNYMVDESIKAYLKQNLQSKLGMPEEDAEVGLDILIGYYEKDHAFNDQETNELIKAIDSVKILDPACGSGAFPMGALHKLVHILHKLDPQNKRWKERQLQKAMAIEDPDIRDHSIDDIEKAFEENTLDYGRKLYLIENCIYGVDIQPIAAQISKLRFFISLIVDQKSNHNPKDNYGIRPLPNLETKFVAANTLIGIEKPKQQMNFLENPEVQKLEDRLKDVRHRLFSAKTPATKRKLREEDKQLRERMGQILENSGWSNQSARQLAAWDPYDQNSSSKWFDPEWMFGMDDGFDIVIGNPPYIQLQKMRNDPIREVYKKQNYEVYEPTGDIYCLFYEKGIQLLCNNGHLCYITSNKWMRAGYGKKMREYFLKFDPKILIDLGPGTFEAATVDTNIFLIKKAQNKKKLSALTIKSKINKNELNLSDYMGKNEVELNQLNHQAWFIGSAAEQQLKEKIEHIGKPLKDWDVNIYRGVLTGLNEAFIIDSRKREEILKNCQTEDERRRTEAIIKPILRGRDIKRYYYEWAGLWVIGTFPALRLNIDDYPAIKKYFLDHFNISQLEQSGKKYSEFGFNARKKTGNKWFETQDQIAYYSEFEKEKVVWAETDQALNTVLVPSKIYLQKTCFMIISSHNKVINAFLNSQLTQWYTRLNSPNLGNKGLSLTKETVQEIPLPPITVPNQSYVQQIETLFDKIILAKKNNPQTDTLEWEKQIDKLVYELYGLTEEEIRIIDESVK
ncbi:Eco57I restriction-modification methylase domain-containing protein [Fidelibacter multiformis]|uniref:Eco57I restriction-modification methylase domain-containing protein n=1 Tax=Fidelibacter multiformis TaxID=3377529 RepID=UPI0037DC3030